MGNPIDHDTSPTNLSTNESLNDVVARVTSRRGFLVNTGTSAAAVARPERPSPSTATFCPS